MKGSDRGALESWGFAPFDRGRERNGKWGGWEQYIFGLGLRGLLDGVFIIICFLSVSSGCCFLRVWDCSGGARV